MKKKLKVQVGIPAYNEQSNIGKLLRSILAQKETNFQLKDIIVVSDASSDETVKEVRKIRTKKIRIINNAKRIGQALSQNQILRRFTGDVLVLLNADVIPGNEYVLSNLVKPFLQNERVGIVGGKPLPLKSRNFIEKVINFSALMKQEIFTSINNSDNIYLCHGRVRAFSRAFVKQFVWESMIGEDAFSYLSAKAKNFLFVYQPKAVVLYRSPQSLTDHLRQSIRFFESQEKMGKYFDEQLVRKEYASHVQVTARKSIIYFFKYPGLFTSYLGVYFLTLVLLQFGKGKEININWHISPSTKRL